MERSPAGHGNPNSRGYRTAARRFPSRVVHPALWVSRAITLLGREHEFLAFAATALDHRLGDAVQDHGTLESVLHVIPRDDRDAGVEFGNPGLPAPSQPTDLVPPHAGIDPEQRHPGQVRRQRRGQQPLLLHRERISRAFVRIASHLCRGRRVQPGSVFLIPPQAHAQVLDPPHDRQVAVAHSRMIPRLQLISDVGPQAAKVHLLERQCADVCVQRRQ